MTSDGTPIDLESKTQLPRSPDSLQFSDDTMRASAKLSYALQEKNGHTDELSKLQESVTQDLEHDGIRLSLEEKQSWSDHTENMISQVHNGISASRETPQITEHIDLKDYKRTIEDIFSTYGLRKKSIKLHALGAIMASNKVLEGLGTVGLSVLVTRLYGAMAGGTLQGQDIGTTVDEMVKRIPKNRSEFIGFGLREGWPVLAFLSILPASLVDAAAKSKFAQEMLDVRKSINARVASSIFMRDFEFVHDKSPAEIMNVIDKGKKGVLDLLSTTYKDVVPHAAVVFGTAIPQVVVSPLMGLASLLRIPLLVKSTEQMVQNLLIQRKEELQRKDYVDSRILTSLGSLEVVKTSPDMEAAIAELEGNMELRDELQIKGEKIQVERGKTSNLLSALFNYGIPLVGVAENVVRKRQGKAVSAAMSGLYGSSIQETSSKELARLYAEHIQPAIQDIKRMEELLGPYDQLDVPDGVKERARKPVDELPNFDIRVRDLRFKHILHGVSIDIPQGTFLTIKGRSGIGKTTFLRHLMGLYTAETGNVHYGGEDLQSVKKYGDQSIYTKLAYANQNPQFFENMTLRENLLLWTQKHISDIEIRQVLTDLNLDYLLDRLDQKTKHFSGGELRRIGLARALLKDPRVLFLDEPTANLDEASSKQVLEIIKRLRQKRKNMTVVAITHDDNFEAIAERIVDFNDLSKNADGMNPYQGNNTRHRMNSISLGDNQAYEASAKAE